MTKILHGHFFQWFQIKGEARDLVILSNSSTFEELQILLLDKSRDPRSEQLLLISLTSFQLWNQSYEKYANEIKLRL